jgi:D-alanyl-D-alanine carboxypeptidase
MGLPTVSLGVNRSMMWSDAGIVSTVDDLNVFLRALAKGRLFENESTLKTMIALPADEEMGYGCGIVIARSGDDTVLFHTGGAGCWMIYTTESDISFIGTMNDADPEASERFGAIHRGFQEILSRHGVTFKSPF